MNKKQKELLISLGINAEISLKNITRIGSKNVKDGWWVRINRDGKRISQTFSDEDYKNTFFALRAAAIFRDDFKSKKIINNSGYFHVSISIYTAKKYPMLRVHYNSEEKAFSISTCGYLSALRDGMRWLNNKDNTLYTKREKLNLDIGLIYLNKNLDFEKYKEILEKTIFDKANGGLYYEPENKKKTILLLCDKNSEVISKNSNFTYNEYVKDTLKFISKSGYNFQIENDNYTCKEDEYYSVFRVEHNTLSKEFCFRLRKLIDFSKKEFYTIEKTALFFKDIYKDNPTVKKDIINKIPNFQTKEELNKYLLSEKEKYTLEKKDLVRKRDNNKDNQEYLKRKNKQIGYLGKVIHDHERLIMWNMNHSDLK